MGAPTHTARKTCAEFHPPSHPNFPRGRPGKNEGPPDGGPSGPAVRSGAPELRAVVRLVAVGGVAVVLAVGVAGADVLVAVGRLDVLALRADVDVARQLIAGRRARVLVARPDDLLVAV